MHAWRVGVLLTLWAGVVLAAEPYRALDQFKPRDAAAVIKAVSLGSSDRERFNPDTVGTQFPSGVTHVLIWYRWDGAKPGHRVRVHWLHEGIKVLEQGEALAKSAGEDAWALTTAGGALPAGGYRVELLENGQTVTAIPFTIGDAAGGGVTIHQYRPTVPGAVIQGVSLSASDTDEFGARRVGTDFPDDTARVVVYYVWQRARPGHRVTARWVRESTTVGDRTQTLGTPSGFGAFSLGPLSAGRYRVELLENGRAVAVIPFRIGAPR